MTRVTLAGQVDVAWWISLFTYHGRQGSVGRFGARNHAENGRLAGTVRADETDLLPLLNRHGRIDEQELVAVLLADGVEANHGAVVGSGECEGSAKGTMPCTFG